MYRDIRGHIPFYRNSAVERFPLKGESVKGGFTVNIILYPSKSAHLVAGNSTTCCVLFQ